MNLFNQTLALTLNSLVEDATGLSGVTEVLITTQIKLLKLTMYGTTRLLIDGKVLAFSQIDKNLCQLVRRIVFEMNSLCKATLQSRIGVYEVMHLVGIAGDDTNELAAIVLQTLQQSINSLSAKAVLIVRFQGIGLIDKQHTAHR